MLSKVKEFFLRKGFMTIVIREPQVEVLFKLIQGKVYFVCFIDDTEDWLVDDRAARIMEFLKNSLEEKFKQYAQSADGLMIVFTGKPKDTLQKLEGDFHYWLAHPTARKLMIYEDQPDTFYDVKELMEGYWKQTPVSAMLAQLKVLGSKVNISLILINIIVFIVLAILGDTTNSEFMYNHGALTAYSVFKEGEFLRLFTSMFLHFGAAHLVYNMVSLLYLGRAMEGAVGSVKYAVLYFLSGLCASLTSALWHNNAADFGMYAVCAGASGAICGVAGALAFYMLKNRKKNANFSFLRWAIFLALIVGQGFGDSSVDNAAHVGGFIAGFIISVVISFIPIGNENKQNGGIL